jgi:hypothetical protein
MSGPTRGRSDEWARASAGTAPASVSHAGRVARDITEWTDTMSDIQYYDLSIDTIETIYSIDSIDTIHTISRFGLFE